MKHITLPFVVSLIALGTGGAQAADWTGFYLGAHLGHARSSGDYDAFTPRNSYDGFDIQGLNGGAFIGGVQLGYNWDMGEYVVGIEGSLSGMSLSKSSNESNEEGEVPDFNRDVDNLFLLMPRIGFEVNDVLLYAKAGLAMTRIGSGHDQSGNVISGSGTEAGWAIGIGAEFPVSERVTGRIDFVHADFGSVRQSMSGSPDIWTNQDVKTQLITFGFNYRF